MISPLVHRADYSLEAALRNSCNSMDFYRQSKKFFGQRIATPVSNRMVLLNDENPGSDGDGVQFHFFGTIRDLTTLAERVNEDMDILLSLGGLVHHYLSQNQTLNLNQDQGASGSKPGIDAWLDVLRKLPSCDEQPVESHGRGMMQSIDELLGFFLELATGAAGNVTGSIVAAFKAFQGRMGVINPSTYETVTQSLVAITCIVRAGENQAATPDAGDYDDGEIVLRLLNIVVAGSFSRRFSSTNYDLNCQQIRFKVDFAPLRAGGGDHDMFQDLLTTSSKEEFLSAKNFFNGGLMSP